MAWKLPLPAWHKRAPEPDIPGVIPAWLPRSANACAWLLILGQIYVLGLWVLDIARDQATPLMLSHVGFWEMAARFYFPVIIGFLAPMIGLPWLTKIGIPIYCELSYKRSGEGWPKAWMAVLIALASLVLCSSGLVVYNGARLEKNREGAVKVEQNDQGRAALQANLDSINADLKDITNPALTTYQAQASREGATAWAKRVATAKAQKDWQADAIERALASAERGDQLRADRKAAILALAAAPTKAAAVERVVTDGDQVTGMVDVVNQWRALVLAFVQDLAALLLGWIAYRLARVRSQQLAAYEAQQPHEEIDGAWLQITDQTMTTQPMPQEEMQDHLGRRMIKVRAGFNEDGTQRYFWRLAPGEKKRGDEPQAPISTNDARFDLPDDAMLDPGVNEEFEHGDESSPESPALEGEDNSESDSTRLHGSEEPLGRDLFAEDQEQTEGEEVDAPEQEAAGAALEAMSPDASGLDNPVLAGHDLDEAQAAGDSAEPILGELTDELQGVWAGQDSSSLVHEGTENAPAMQSDEGLGFDPVEDSEQDDNSADAESESNLEDVRPVIGEGLQDPIAQDDNTPITWDDTQDEPQLPRLPAPSEAAE